MLIKHKLTTNTIVTIISMLAMLLLLNFSSSSLQQDITLAQNIGKIEAGILQLRSHEKDFLARKKSEYIDLFNVESVKLQTRITKLKSELKVINVSAEKAIHLGKVLSEYQQYFTEVVDTQKRIGLDPKSGLSGKLGKAVDDAELAIGDSISFLNVMLQIRSSEKNYIHLLDDKYVKDFQENFAILYAEVKRSYLVSTQKKAILAALDSYQTTFLALVSEQKKLGYHAHDGLQKSLNESAQQVTKIQTNLVAQTDAAVTDYVQSIKQITYILFAVALFVSIAIGWVISRSIMNGILYIKNSIVRISETNDLTISISTKNNDELADIANAFNNMLANFQHLIVSVNQSVASLNNATATLAKNIHRANEGVESQMQETDMVATAVTEMVATIEEIASNTTDAADKAEQTNQNAAKGKLGVDATINQIRILSDKLIESESVVNLLAKDSETIGSVLDVIRGIAEQTNLLALNAAIEAARAGEQGRGFAVVADEVRTLASRTQESTKEIESIISSLQSRTKNIVNLTTDCRSEGQESAEQAGKAGQLLEEINHDIVSIMDMNTAIATAIQEQSAVASEVNRHVVSIRDVAETASESAQQNELMSDELSEQAKVLTKEIKRFTI
ncbi:MAG: methyl-accepting chemotaxis protein [Oleiphilaceae bacterium]|jgi:methyl-accepting chemotaxis protein